MGNFNHRASKERRKGIMNIWNPGYFRYTGLHNTALAKAQSVQEAIKFQNAHPLQIEAMDNNE